MKLLNFFLFLLLSVLVFSQEIPPIQNFSSLDYGARNQNWEISQSDEGYIYAANNSGLLEFNGVKWNLYPSPNGSEVRTVKVVGDRIYSGCYMEFGYWEKDATGQLKYTSLLTELKGPLIEDEQFWNIIAYDKWLLFQSLNRIYVYDAQQKSFEIIEAETTRARIFSVGKSIYFQKGSYGLFKIENRKSKLVTRDASIRDNIIINMFQVDEKLLLVTENGQFYWLNEGKLIQWRIDADTALLDVNVYSAIQKRNKEFILGTISNGIYHIDDKGKLLHIINQQKGLNNNTVLSILEDNENNIWLGLDNGISVLNFDSPFKEYIDHIGRLGVVYTAINHKGNLYLGTNQGLFYKPNNVNEEFKLIPNTRGQVWCLREFNGALFCGHNTGTFLVNGTSVKKISSFPGTWDIKSVPNNPSILLQGNYNGLSILEWKNGIWQLKNTIDGFTISSRFFEFADAKKVIVNHERKGIYKLELDVDYTKVVKLSNETNKGYGASLVAFDASLLYSSNNGIYKYDSIKDAFIQDSLLTKTFFDSGDKLSGILVSDNAHGKLWGFGEENIFSISKSNFSSEPTLTKIPISSTFRKSMGIAGFEYITPISPNKYLVGFSNGYVTVDMDKLSNKDYTISVTSIEKYFYDLPKVPVPINTIGEFNHKDNNLSFAYSVLEVDKYKEVKYQYKLSGLYKEWSNWSAIPDVSFKNLPFGDYDFSVRAKVGSTLTKNIENYKFNIARPWYASITAIIGYCLLALLFFFVLHKLYKRYYRKQQELSLKRNLKKQKRKEIKVQKELIQIKNEKLEQEIASKSRELAVSTMSIIKKNEFLSSIKDQLKIIDGSVVKRVIKTIDKNITSNDDWKFFEEAFNNADKGFLKKVKDAHSGLTSNDLKLCAYLRLNLSSKEIAPLLNISVRSVEVKRYRLRKKMNLPHDNSLSQYIIDL